MLMINQSKVKRESIRSVKNTLKEMMGPVSNQEEDFKLKILLGLGNTHDKTSYKSIQNVCLQEELTTDMNSHNSKETICTQVFQECSTREDGKFS